MMNMVQKKNIPHQSMFSPLLKTVDSEFGLNKVLESNAWVEWGFALPKGSLQRIFFYV